MDILTVIQTVGFPIACVLGLAIYFKSFITQVMNESCKRETTLLEANKELAVALNKSADAITEAAKDHVLINSKLDVIETTVNELKEKL